MNKKQFTWFWLQCCMVLPLVAITFNLFEYKENVELTLSNFFALIEHLSSRMLISSITFIPVLLIQIGVTIFFENIGLGNPSIKTATQIIIASVGTYIMIDAVFYHLEPWVLWLIPAYTILIGLSTISNFR